MLEVKGLGIGAYCTGAAGKMPSTVPVVQPGKKYHFVQLLFCPVSDIIWNKTLMIIRNNFVLANRKTCCYQMRSAVKNSS